MYLRKIVGRGLERGESYSDSVHILVPVADRLLCVEVVILRKKNRKYSDDP